MRALERWLICGAICLLWVGAAHAKGGPKQPPGDEGRPKNIILMIGDGMGPQQVESARLLDPDGELVLHQMDPDPGFMTTDDAFGGVTDSAASATAMATGHKTYNGAISVDLEGNPLETALERAEVEGKATGILSSVYLTDATPAVWAAHALARGLSAEIAVQQAAAGVELLLGSGEVAYLDRGAVGTGGPNLVEEMVADSYELVKSAEELANAEAPEGKLLGFWGGFAMPYVLDRQQNAGLGEPTLAQMTAKAIEVLSRDADGFFLVVEGGAIDWVAHNRDVAGTAAETLAFDGAVAVALDFAGDDGDTLLIATADHETGGLMLGDPVKVDFIAGITATTEFMWGAIERGDVTVEGALEAQVGIGDAWPPLTPEEKAMIDSDGEMGISDVLSERAGVSWGWSGKDDGEHTPTDVPVFAFGPGSESLEGSQLDNTDIGAALFSVLNGN